MGTLKITLLFELVLEAQPQNHLEIAMKKYGERSLVA